MVLHLQTQLIKWTKFGDLKATFEGKTKFVEQVWKQFYFLKKLFLRKITWETTFSFRWINQISDWSSECDRIPYWKTIKRSLSNVKNNFSKKKFFLPTFTSERLFYYSEPDEKSHQTMPKNVHQQKPHLERSQPLLQEIERFFPYMLFFRKFASKKLILHLPTQLNIWYTSLCEPINNIRKHLNFSPKVLKTISVSEMKFSPTRVEKDDLHLRLQLNNWYKCLDDPKNFIWGQIQPRRVKPKWQLSENDIFVLVSLEEIVVWNAVFSVKSSFNKWSWNFRATKIKRFAVI